MSDLLWCCETFDWQGGDERRFIFARTREAREHAGVRSARSNDVWLPEHSETRGTVIGPLIGPATFAL
jgi:hypothetical protein